MATLPDPLDEIKFSKPETVRFYVQNGMPYMHENMLHYYISESPFFDWGSKNGTEIQLSNGDGNRQALLHNRKEWERHLAAANGVEYVLAEGETIEHDAQGGVVKGGMWVVRKQDREKGTGSRGRDEVTTLGTYYIMGEEMFQAPSVGDVLGTRLLAASTAMSRLYQQASTLPRWSSSTGHTYLSPSSKSTASTGTAVGSRADTPDRSRQTSLAAENASVRSGSVEPTITVPGSQADTDRLSNALLLSSMASFRAYGDEFSDDNPLVGEPGNFTFSSSTAAVKKRKAEEDAAAQVAAEAAARAKDARAASRTGTPATAAAVSPAVTRPPSPPAIMTEAKAGKAERERKGSRKDEKGRRRKSKHGGVLTPSSATSSLPASTI